jgi:hypothetical protein
MAEQFLKELQTLIEFQGEVCRFHPAFEGHYPIAIVADGQFLIYDWSDDTGAYILVKTAPLHMEIPDGAMAAFPLAPYGGQTTAVVTPAIFERPDWTVMLLHEFVHCYQSKVGVNDLRYRLTICKEEEARGHVTWEIDHLFPFTEEAFVAAYLSFLEALAQNDPERVRQIRRDLKQLLPLREYEYMVWEEWVEGFARWNENRLRDYLGLSYIDVGAAPPFNRVTFYVGGAAYIDLLVRRHPEMAVDLTALFEAMVAGEI